MVVFLLKANDSSDFKVTMSGSSKVTNFVRSRGDRLSARFAGVNANNRKTPPVVVSGLDRTSVSRRRKKNNDEGLELAVLQSKAAVQQQQRPCVLCVGTTGSGKSSTVSRYTGQRAASSAGFERQTQECGLFEPLDGHGPVWVDTVGWEDSAYDDELSFQDILRFLQENDITQIKAIIWNVIPNIRRDSVLVKQARFIDLFKPGEIWRNVIIVCKQSMKPESDGTGALKAAEEFAGSVIPQLVGYRFITDLDESQRAKLESDAETRRAFNVKTNEEVRDLLAERLSHCGDAIDLVFRECKCLDCGVVADPRLMPLYCHMELLRVHTQGVFIVHPLPVEAYHESDVQIAEHDGVLLRPWYGKCSNSLGPKRYTCCNRKYGKPGCVVKWACCRRPVSPDYEEIEDKSGCRRRFACCREDPDLARDGCEARHVCCGKRSGEQGCAETCRKCGKEWGTSAENNCFRKSHNVTDNWRALEMQQLDKTTESGGTGNGDVSFRDDRTNDNYRQVKMVFGLPPLVLAKPF